MSAQIAGDDLYGSSVVKSETVMSGPAHLWLASGEGYVPACLPESQPRGATPNEDIRLMGTSHSVCPGCLAYLTYDNPDDVPPPYISTDVREQMERDENAALVASLAAPEDSHRVFMAGVDDYTLPGGDGPRSQYDIPEPDYGYLAPASATPAPGGMFLPAGEQAYMPAPLNQ